MKRVNELVSVLLVLCLLACLPSAQAQAVPAQFTQGRSWVCPACGAVNTGSACYNCSVVLSASYDAQGGTLPLYMSFSLKKNLILAKYDVDVYLDEQLVGTVPQGGSFRQVFLCSPGVHTVKLCKPGNNTTRGVVQINLLRSAAFCCDLETHIFSVEIDNKRIGPSASQLSEYGEEDYRTSCLSANYEQLARYPDQNKGIHVKLSGRVAAIYNANSSLVNMLIRDAQGNFWMASVFMQTGSRRFLVNDTLTLYAEYRGLTDYQHPVYGDGSAPSLLVYYTDY